MSCTFDLKIKLIWEVFKALLICIRLLAVAMRFARFFLKLEILLPIPAVGCNSPNLTTPLLTFFLGHKAEFHIRSQNSWFWFSYHLSCPFCSMSQTDSHNTFLSLTFFRNSEAALSPTKMFGCCVTAKHFTICFPSSSLNLDCASKKVPHIFQYDTEIQMKGLFLKRKKGYKRHDPYQIMEPMIPYSLLCQFPSSSKKKKNSMLFCIIVGQLRKTQ